MNTIPFFFIDFKDKTADEQTDRRRDEQTAKANPKIKIETLHTCTF